MHVHHADRYLPQSSSGCGRHSDADAQVTLRRKAQLEVAATQAPQAPAPTPAAVTAAPNSVSACGASDCSTYDLTAMRRQKGSLSILTQDGDTVQVRFRTREGVAVQSSTTESAEGSTSTTTVHAFASGRVRVEVNGELDADELKAIGDLMDKVDSLAAQFFEGDTQAAFSAAAELGFDSGEIAGYALRLSVKEYARVSVPAPAVAPPPSVVDSGAAVPASSSSIPAASEPPVVPSAPAEAAPTAEVPASPEPVAAEVVPEAPVAPAPAPAADPLAALQQSLGSFLKQVLEGLSSVSGTGRAEFSMRWKLQVLVEAVQTAPAAAASDPAGTQLATDSLAELATAQA